MTQSHFAHKPSCDLCHVTPNIPHIRSASNVSLLLLSDHFGLAVTPTSHSWSMDTLVLTLGRAVPLQTPIFCGLHTRQRTRAQLPSLQPAEGTNILIADGSKNGRESDMVDIWHGRLGDWAPCAGIMRRRDTQVSGLGSPAPVEQVGH